MSGIKQAQVGGGGAAAGLRLLSEQTISGSNATTMDFSSLDLDLHENYIIKAEIINPSSVVGNAYRLFCNADFTVSNYVHQLTASTKTTVNSTDGTGPTIGTTEGGLTDDRLSVEAFIGLDDAGHITILARSYRHKAGGAGDPANHSWVARSTTTFANITALRLAAAITDGLGTGTNVKLYGTQ